MKMQPTDWESIFAIHISDEGLVYRIHKEFFEEDLPWANICHQSSSFPEEGWPWANIHAHLPLLYVWDTCHIMAWQAVCRSAPGIWTGEPQAAEAECAHLTTALPGWTLPVHFKKSRTPIICKPFYSYIIYTSHCTYKWFALKPCKAEAYKDDVFHNIETFLCYVHENHIWK